MIFVFLLLKSLLVSLFFRNYIIMKINSYLLLKINNLIKFGIFSLFLFFLMIVFLKGTNYTIAKALFSFLYGLSIGFVYEITNKLRFYRLPFIIRIFIRITLLLFFISLILTLVDFLIADFISTEYENIFTILLSVGFQNVFIEILLITGFLVLFIELEKQLGNGFILDFFLSKYQKPIQQNRVIMFLDLKDSTTIAEKIGNIEFVSFINLCYSVLTNATIVNNGIILKYVGDEVIITWSEKNGIKNNNCINLYFDFVDDLEKNKALFIEKYGFFPVFKAGIHSGEVTAAILGTIKRQMDYSGDVMNTTARIQSLCNEYKTNLLISESLASLLSENKNIKFNSIGKIQLRGRNEKIGLTKVEKIG